MFFQVNHSGYSVSVPFRSKALSEGNGLGQYLLAISKHWNALRVSLSAPTDCVVPLIKDTAIACKERLAGNADKLAEFAILTLKAY